MRIKFSKFDLRQVGVLSDPITATVDPAASLRPTGGNAVGLNPNGQLTLTGSASLTVATSDCLDVSTCNENLRMPDISVLAGECAHGGPGSPDVPTRQ